MKGLIASAVLLLQASLVTAICVTDPASLLVPGMTLDDLFTLEASTLDGSQSYPVNVANTPEAGGFFFPLTLAGKNETETDLAQFQLSNGQAFANGGSLATKANFILFPQQLYTASDSAAVSAAVGYVNATCNGQPAQLLRFINALGLPLGKGDIANGFAPGSFINSPILTGILDIAPLNLIIKPVPSSQKKRATKYKA